MGKKLLDVFPYFGIVLIQFLAGSYISLQPRIILINLMVEQHGKNETT